MCQQMDEGITRRYQDRNDNFHRRDNSRQKFRRNGTKTEWGRGRRRVQDKKSTSSELCSIYIDDCEKRLASIGDLINSDTRFMKDFKETFRKNEHILTKNTHSIKRNLLNPRFLDEHNNISRFEVGNLKNSQSKRRLHTDGRESSNTSYCYPLENQLDFKNRITKYEHYHHRGGENGSLEKLSDIHGTRKDLNISNVVIRNKQEDSTNSMHNMDMPIQNTEHYRRNRDMYYKENPGYAVKQNEYYPKVNQQEKHYYAHNHENGSFEKYLDIHGTNTNLNVSNPIRNRQKTYERRAVQLPEAGHRVNYSKQMKKNNFTHIPKYNTLIERNTEVHKNENTLRNRSHTKENYLRTDSYLNILNVMDETRIQQRHPKNGNYEGSKIPFNQFKEFRNGYNIQVYDSGIAKVFNDESKTERSNVSAIHLEEKEVMKSENSLVGPESQSNSIGPTFDRDVTIRKGNDVTIDDPKIIQIAKLILDCFQNDKDLESKYRETIDENNIHRKNTDSRRNRTSKTNHTIPTKRYEDVYAVNRIVSQNVINYGSRVPGFDKKHLKAADVFTPRSLREQYLRRSSEKVQRYRTKGYQTSTSKLTRHLLPRKYQDKQLNQNEFHGKNQSSSLEPQNTEKIREVSVQLENQLPLYDENAHLLGYLKEGTLIIGPSCPKSCDSSLYLGDENCEPLCPFSICNKATQLKDVTNTPASARWTYGSNFASSVRHQLVKAKFDRCPKCVRCNEATSE